MEINKSKLKSAIKKVTAVTLSALLINAMLLITQDTYSWFISKAQSNSVLRAAATDDLLEKLEIVDEYNQRYDLINAVDNKTIINPEYIIAKGKDAVQYTIYFELSHSINEFILHVNPLYVNNQAEERADLNISLDPAEFNETKAVLESSKDNPDKEPILGTITVKYLNNYINKTVNVAFTRSFLLERDKETVLYLESKEAEIQTLQSDLKLLTEEQKQLAEANIGLEEEKSSLEKDKEALTKDKEQLERRIKVLEEELAEYPSKDKGEGKDEQPAGLPDNIPSEAKTDEPVSGMPIVEPAIEPEKLESDIVEPEEADDAEGIPEELPDVESTGNI